MLAQIVALLVAAAPAPAPDTPARTVSPVTVTPQGAKPAIDATVDMASDDNTAGEFVAIWPGAAYRAGADGKVILSCKVNIHGLAEWCGIKSETPAGKNFGAAALQMRPTFKLKPAMGPDGPIEAMMNIAVKFRAPLHQIDTEEFKSAKGMAMASKDSVDLSYATFLGVPMEMEPVTMLSRPVWSQAPGFDDLARAYPAKAGGAEGYVVAHCQVLSSGDLKNCGIVKEMPWKLGFAKAALPLTHKFRVAAELAQAPHSTPMWVDIPIRMPPPGAEADRMVLSPSWLTGVDPATTPGVFPPEAAARGLTAGRGVAQCVVGPDGAMTQCAAQPGDPDGLGFSEAVAKLAATLKINLWSADASPVDGGKVRVEMRIKLKGG
jgi:TonB family protein